MKKILSVATALIIALSTAFTSYYAENLTSTPDEIFPLEYKVDYVRLYQKDNGRIFINNNPDLSNIII